jgi:hypothetical protein
MQNNIKKQSLVTKMLQSPFSKQRKSAPVAYEFEDEKIPVEIRDIWRIRPQDIQAFIHALEDFAKGWE